MKKCLALITLMMIFNIKAMADTHFKKVVWIVFENTNYDRALAQSDFKKLTLNGTLFSNFQAEVHPSQGNYIAMIAGSKLNVINDNVINLSENHIGDLLEDHKLSWKAYAENYPGNCFTGKSLGTFYRKHVPFLSFSNVTSDKTRCLNIEDDKKFYDDLTHGTLPEFSMFTPNIKNDGHDTNVDFAGKWLSSKFGNLLSHPESLGDLLFIITFDESGPTSPKNQIFTVLLGSHVKTNNVNTQALTHPALLKMIEDEYSIGNLGRDDAHAPVIQNIWK